MRTTLESGAWVDHRPIQDLKGKDKRTLSLLSKMRISPDENGDISVAQIVGGMNMFQFAAEQQDAVWALVLTGWSFELPVPAITGTGADVELVNIESFGELPLDDFDELEQVFAPYQAKLARRPDPKARAAATTTSSNGSSRASGAHGSRRG